MFVVCVCLCVWGLTKHMKILQELSVSLMVNKVILFKVDKQQTKQKTKKKNITAVIVKMRMLWWQCPDVIFVMPKIHL